MTQSNGAGRISEHIFELRYKPNPKVLDKRGLWAELISAEMSLPEWRIIENRIDIFSKANSESAFVGFRNTGFTTYDSPTANYFPDKASKFLKFLMTLEGFDNPVFVERIGIRSRFAVQYSEGFDQLRDRFSTRYLSLTAEAVRILDATVVDIGAPINFVDRLGNFNTTCGPMNREQLKEFFPKSSNQPDVSLFYDIDYWLKPLKAHSDQDLIRLIKDFAGSAWLKHDKIDALICED